MSFATIRFQRLMALALMVVVLTVSMFGAVPRAAASDTGPGTPISCGLSLPVFSVSEQWVLVNGSPTLNFVGNTTGRVTCSRSTYMKVHVQIFPPGATGAQEVIQMTGVTTLSASAQAMTKSRGTWSVNVYGEYKDSYGVIKKLPMIQRTKTV